MSNRITVRIRQTVLERARGCCEYCKCQDSFAPESFSIDHILPRSLDGSNLLENLALSCLGCNSHKSNKTQGLDPEQGVWVDLYNPRLQDWDEHFAWSPNYLMIVGKTSVGRATVATLKLNKERVMNLRRALSAIGEHPPQ